MVPQIETYKLGEENLSRSVGFHEKGGGQSQTTAVWIKPTKTRQEKKPTSTTTTAKVHKSNFPSIYIYESHGRCTSTHSHMCTIYVAYPKDDFA